MLVLSRKPGEEIVIPGGQVTVTVLGVEGNRVRLGVSAPREVTIRRQEIEPLIHRPPRPSVNVSLAPYRILLATPNRCTLKAYANELKARSAVVATATTGLECIESLRATMPEVLVLGLNLLWGGEDGVLNLLADEPALRPRCVMVVAQSRSPGALYRISGFRVDDYHTSHLSANELANRICTLLNETCPKSVLQ